MIRQTARSILMPLALLLGAPAAAAQGEDAAALYRFQGDSRTHWISPENPTGAPGIGGRENRGAKGHAFETIPIGQSHVLADIQGAGTIDRLWLTIEDRSPEALRGLKLEFFWDGARRPAVSVPLGDFFRHGAGVPESKALRASQPIAIRTGNGRPQTMSIR